MMKSDGWLQRQITEMILRWWMAMTLSEDAFTIRWLIFFVIFIGRMMFPPTIFMACDMMRCHMMHDDERRNTINCNIAMINIDLGHASHDAPATSTHHTSNHMAMTCWWYNLKYSLIYWICVAEAFPRFLFCGFCLITRASAPFLCGKKYFDVIRRFLFHISFFFFKACWFTDISAWYILFHLVYKASYQITSRFLI